MGRKDHLFSFMKTLPNYDVQFFKNFIEQLLDCSTSNFRPQQKRHPHTPNEPITAQFCFSIPPETISKPFGFLMFSGGIEKQHWAVMG